MHISPLMAQDTNRENKYAVIVSANIEWNALKKEYPNENYLKSIFGEYFFKIVQNQKVLFFHEGWGKVFSSRSNAIHNRYI